MKKILFILIGLLLIQVVSASSPDFQINHVLNTNVINGDNNLGSIVFIEKPYISDVYEISTIQMRVYQKYDILKWMGGNTIKVVSPTLVETVLVTGSQYYFDNVGSYNYESLLNPLDKNLILINDEDTLNINITYLTMPPGFNFTFDRYNILLDGEQTSRANLKIDDDVSVGNYTLGYQINNITYSKTVSVIENLNWSIDYLNTTFNKTIKSGENSLLGRIKLVNTGNVDIEIKLTKEGNISDMINIPINQSLFRKNSIYLDFAISVPITTAPGNYNSIIRIMGANKTENISFDIRVLDAIKPVIESINFSSEFVGVNNTITVYATDNNDVKNVTLNYDANTYYLTKDGSKFTKSFIFDKVSKYDMLICAYDFENNQECRGIEQTFTKLNVIFNYSKVMEMDAMKYGKYSNRILFNISSEMIDDVTLELVSIDMVPFSENITPTVRVITPDGSIINFDKYQRMITINQDGNYFLEVRSDLVSDVSGVLRLTMPDKYKAIEDITFKTGFKDYDVAQPFEKEWLDGRKFICEVVDTGNLDTSFYNCSLQYPIETREVDISVPMTVDQKNKIEEQIDTTLKDWDKYKIKSRWIIGLISGMFIITLLFSGYMIYWFPYIRLQMGKTISDEKIESGQKKDEKEMRF